VGRCPNTLAIFESKQEFANWIKDLIADYGFVEGVDFLTNLSKSTGGRQAIEYTLTMDMAKEISMVQRSEKGRQARRYFIECEKRLRHLSENPTALPIAKNAFNTVLYYCRKQQHEGQTWYAANMLKRLTGKGENMKMVCGRLAQEGKAKMLPEVNQEKWYVVQSAIAELLCIQPTNLVNIALIEMIQSARPVLEEKGGAL
jgi:phage anti-repressor protein